MSNRPLPDFTDALEQHLRSLVESPQRHGSAPTRRFQRLRTRRVSLAAATALAATATALLVVSQNETTVAYGKPAILREAPTPAPEVIAQLERGISTRLVLGPNAQLTEVRSIVAFASTAYVVTGPDGWCLVVPDPKLGDDALKSGAVSCTRISDVYRYGIALAVGDNLLAALPDHATAPTLTGPDGTKQTLRPSALGIVVADHVAAGSVLTLFGEDGSERHLQVG